MKHPPKHVDRRNLATALAFLAATALSTWAGGPKGTLVNITVPNRGKMNADGIYWAWVPEGTAPLRSIIVHQHGCGNDGDGARMVHDLQWLTLARKWNSVLVGPIYKSIDKIACRAWCFPDQGGSDLNLMEMLDSLARRTRRPEIKTIPWALWGHSGGSYWVMDLTRKYPGRVVGTIAQSWGLDISSTAAAMRVPMLHHNGHDDIVFNDEFFLAGRKQNALWAHAVNPGPGGHGAANLRTLAIPWLDHALASRLPDAAGTSLLKPMDTADAYYGDKATRAFAPVGTFSGNRSTACWLPNRAFASLWSQYMATGMIKDSTPPPAPYNLSGAYANGTVALKWDADADLETGIKTFIVYRNGAALKTLAYATKHAYTTETGFQRWDFGDAPTPSPAPAMTWTDPGADAAGTFVYQVATVNWSNVAGPPGGDLTVTQGRVTTGLIGSAGPAKPVGAGFPASPTVRWIESGGWIRLPPGISDIHDIHGRYLETLEVAPGQGAVRRSLRNISGPRICLVRSRSAP